jgi:hypothetical protein
MGNMMIYSVRLESNIIKKMKVLAEKEGLSVSHIIRMELENKFPVRMRGNKK